MEFIRRLIPLILQFLNKILVLRFQSLSLNQWEEEVYGATQWLACKVLEVLLESYDDHLMRRRDPRRWRLVHTKTRTVLTSLGPLRIRRRYYRDCETGRRVYLLDQALGLAPRQRVSDRLQERMVDLATEMSYHRAEVPPGERQVRELAVEADGVWVSARREQEGDPRHVEIKLAVAYEGRTETGRLQGRKVVAGVMAPEDFWEQTVAIFGQTWDWSAVQRCWLGSDGAGWLKEGVEMLPHAVYRLDRYHLRRALVEGLGGDSQEYERVAQAIAEGDWEKAQTGLRETWERASKNRRKRIQALERYLENNWAGIVKLPGEWRLGAIEGQVFHHVARRMKRHGARWSARGADHLVRLLAVKASGEWDRFMSRRGRADSGELERRVTRRWNRQLARAAGEWLQTHLPVLEGPAADRPWVQHVLRELVRAEQRLW